MKKKSVRPPSPVPAANTPLAELETLCAAPLVVECTLFDRPIRLTGRRLLRAERAQLLEWLQAALPPLLPPEPGSDEPRYDLRNPDYQRTKRAGELKARAMGLYWAFPTFAELVRRTLPEGAGPPTPEQVMAAFEASTLEEELLEYLWARLNESVVLVDMRRVGFTSGSSNPAS